jgi:hypothetical protein
MRALAASHQSVPRSDILPLRRFHVLGRRAVKRREVNAAGEAAFPCDERAAGRASRLAVAVRLQGRETLG